MTTIKSRMETQIKDIVEQIEKKLPLEKGRDSCLSSA
jgi:hypothetical protein